MDAAGNFACLVFVLLAASARPRVGVSVSCPVTVQGDLGEAVSVDHRPEYIHSPAVCRQSSETDVDISCSSFI